MLTIDMVEKLNEQVKKEMEASNFYLALSSWCYQRGYDGAGKFLFDQSQEESDHARRLVTYLNETDSKVEIKSLEAPVAKYETLLQVFEAIYDHEKNITKYINDLVDHALINKDYGTFNFLQWYVSEQHEELALFRDIVDKLHLLSESNNGLHLADQYIKGIKVER